MHRLIPLLVLGALSPAGDDGSDRVETGSRPPGSEAPAPPADVSRAFWNWWDATYREGQSLDTIDADSAKRGRTALHWLDGLRLPPTAQILEVGCANGWLSEPMSRFGVVTGTDLADEVIARAQARRPDLRFIAGDFLSLPFAPGSFDVVVSLETLSMVADQRAFLGRAADLLVPGGYLILTAHNRFVYERYDGVAPQRPGQVRRWLYWSELRTLLEARFRIRRHTTLAPVGHGGVLRIVNSYKLQALLGPVVGPERLDRIREMLGFGQTFAVLAQRRS